VIPPQPVLKHYGSTVKALRWHPVTGGFSGAQVWGAVDEAGTPLFALKQWPPEMTAERLSQIHTWMTQTAHLAFIPAIPRTTDDTTVVTHDNRVWDMTRWMPGAAREAPSAAEVEAACAAVARLHAVWRTNDRAPCPGVLNRLKLLRDWLASPVSPDSILAVPPSLVTRLHAAARLVANAAPAAVRALEAWETVRLRVQPCLRDLRAEHVLLNTEGAVTGIIDFGAMAVDHPAVDLARLLGDYAAADATLFELGLRAYQRGGGELDSSDEFVRLLARTGALGSVVMWFFRLALNRHTALAMEGAEARISRLIRRIEEYGHI
jgi:homoserine kinase type II